MTTADAMTEISTNPTNGTPASDWDAQFAELRTRFPGTKDSVLFCIHALQQDPDVPIGDLKAQAAMHSVRVTAASVAAAQRLLAPAGPAAAATPATPAPGAEYQHVEPGQRARRTRIRKPEPQIDLESMVRQVVAKASESGEAKVSRMRAAIQRAIEVLRVAVEWSLTSDSAGCSAATATPPYGGVINEPCSLLPNWASGPQTRREPAAVIRICEVENRSLRARSRSAEFPDWTGLELAN